MHMGLGKINVKLCHLSSFRDWDCYNFFNFCSNATILVSNGSSMDGLFNDGADWSNNESESAHMVPIIDLITFKPLSLSTFSRMSCSVYKGFKMLQFHTKIVVFPNKECCKCLSHAVSTFLLHSFHCNFFNFWGNATILVWNWSILKPL